MRPWEIPVMDKKTLFLFLLGILALPVFVSAVSNINDLMRAIVYDVVWVVFVGIVVICFVYAGVLFLSAYGDPGKLQKARSAFLWGVVGVIVGIVAYSAVTLISNIIG